MKRLTCLAAMAATCCVAHGAAGLRPSEQSRLPIGAVRPEGWLRVQLEKQRDGITGNSEKLYDDIGRSDWLTGEKRGGQYSWERGPYYAKGLLSLAFALDDTMLKARAKKWVDAILASQRENGAFGPKDRNWWANMIALWLVRDWAEATGDKRVVPFLEKYFNFQKKEFAECPISGDSMWAVARTGDEMDVVFWLYEQTGKDEWLEFARTLSKESADWTTYYRRGGAPGGDKKTGYRCHIVNFMQGLKTPALQWRLDGDARKRDAYHSAFDPEGWVMRMCGRPDRMVNGSEPLIDRSATGGTELCAIAERILSCQTHLTVFADVEVADDLEMVAYNSLPATLAPDGKGIRYYCLLNQPACLDKFLLFANNGDRNENVGAICPGPHAGFGCCRSNFHLAWPKFAQSMWMGRDGGLAAVAYGPCDVSTPAADVIETGDYPFGPNVTLKVTRAKGGEWPLFVRIPGWCSGAKVAVNGKDAGLTAAGTFKRIDREWKAGDEVTLVFPMEARVSHWEMDAVAVTRGPLLYSLEIPMEERKVKKYKVPYENEWIDDFGGDFPRKELLPKGPWNYVLSLGKDGKTRDGILDDAKVSVVLVPSDPFVPGNAPVTISVPAKRSDFGGWGYMREVTTGRAVDPPPSPIPDEGGEMETLKLVPFGSTQLRISLFPWCAKKDR
ncbi:MAG: glycoside hydrolase family 127 protein [Kiritimatiellae bacterium]|nr:glycoside hydrolase family 127 protein [Kiritimatiellia bacterium]